MTAPERALGFVAGIGSGKSHAGVVRTILASQGQIGGRVVPTPNVGMVTAPTYNMLKDATLRDFQEVAGSLVVKFNKSDMVATMVNGSEVLFRSADNPERLRGPNLMYWYADEAALQTENAFNIMIGRLRQHKEPGWWWLTTTPKGKDWVYRKLVLDAVKLKSRLFTVPSWRNPFVHPDWLRTVMATYEGDFARQELEGVFISHEGLIYPEFNRDAHETTDLPGDLGTVYAGMDFGYKNPGVIHIGSVDHDGNLVIVHEEYKRERTDADWTRVAADLNNDYGVNTFFCDPSGKDYISMMRAAGLNAVPAENAVSTGIQAVRKRLMQKSKKGATEIRRLRFASSCVRTFAEFEQYQWKKGRDGYPLEEPVKSNDHTMDALRYLVMGIDGKPAAPPIDMGVSNWSGR